MKLRTQPVKGTEMEKNNNTFECFKDISFEQSQCIRQGWQKYQKKLGTKLERPAICYG